MSSFNFKYAVKSAYYTILRSREIYKLLNLVTGIYRDKCLFFVFLTALTAHEKGLFV